jgi:prephenate dehydrogenase
VTSHPGTVLVVGTGLVGTSLALALRDRADVLLKELDGAHLRAATQRGAGRPWDGEERVDLAVVAVPPAVTGPVCTALLRTDLARTVSQVASTQAHVQLHVETHGADLTRYCGGHPLAGKEVRGPTAASARLFLDRPWVVCPSPVSSPRAVADVTWLAEQCGAVPVVMAAEEHDRAVALVSHLVQVSASALAGRLAGAAPDVLRLAGPGVQDSTRVAASDPGLWVDVLRTNARQVAPLVHGLAADLSSLGAALDALSSDPEDAGAAAVVEHLLHRGRQGRAALPLKARPGGGDGTAPLTPVVVDVPDEPGQLAGAFAATSAAGVNVEDVRVEHLPGRPRGLLELLVAAHQAPSARDALTAAGYDVLGE